MTVMTCECAADFYNGGVSTGIASNPTHVCDVVRDRTRTCIALASHQIIVEEEHSGL